MFLMGLLACVQPGLRAGSEEGVLDSLRGTDKSLGKHLAAESTQFHRGIAQHDLAHTAETVWRKAFHRKEVHVQRHRGAHKQGSAYKSTQGQGHCANITVCSISTS